MAEEINNKMSVHLITYGSNQFTNSKERLKLMGRECGWFNSVKTYDPNNLTNDFKSKYSDILNEKRGGGYWIWKYDIIKQRLDEIKDGDYLVYLDAGCTINKNGYNRFKQYLDMLKDNKYGIISFIMNGQHERKWTTKELFNYFKIDLDDSIATSGQIIATVIIMKKCSHTYKIIEECHKVIEKDKYLITDKYNSNQNSYFIDNRHDQSILSLIRKIFGSVIINDETFHQPFGNEESMNKPFWATRKR